ncbi:JmjC domain-containing histone demethylation protein 1 [Dimargaris verticillata]|uniref:[histone H3]-dimethyl-L-lysine(36) demethylase n=1 Tax=Dimargaris verticillata TaxID=2761393 RepID=A0A9W8AY83_9FUNG|nr:JmjC domain-containing histone demethylation protein 1 [Dimargaris verticillata]
MQLDMYYMEERVAIPQRQRFPLFERMQWFAAQHYLKRLNDSIGPTSLPPRLSKGLKRLLEFLNTMLARAKRDPSSLATVEQRRLAKLAIPDNLNDPAKLVADLEKALAER